MSDTNKSQVLFFQADDGGLHVNVRLQGETVWLTQAAMAELFDCTSDNVSLHLKNIYETCELQAESTTEDFSVVRQEGPRQVSRLIKHYNLDAIIAVGYRVNSKRATQFRIWATAILKEYMIKGFTMDDSRLKELGGGGYWKELLERIRDIRASEKVFYRQILDIYATSMDYDPDADESVTFFKKVQNKIHYAVHGQTAAEVIYTRADAEKEFMGLTTFSGNRPHLSDAVVAKNYLNPKELRALGQLVSGYLDFAERQAERHVPMKMSDWAEQLDKILTATGEQLLIDAGQISHDQAVEKARIEYVKYQARTLSDVEKQYLATLKIIDKAAKKRGKK